MWIVNTGYHNIEKGNHPFEPETMLIQIVDSGIGFPQPKKPFSRIYQFEFSDVDDPQSVAWDYRIKETDAQGILNVLHHAKENNHNIVVHCIAGVSRSGAVVQFAVDRLDFIDLEEHRDPNQLILQMLNDVFEKSVI